jgi:hypothetical protein
MTYKKIILMMIFIILFLSACEKPEDNEEQTPAIQTYQLESSNFENFYVIDYFLDFDLEGSYEVALTLKDIYEFDISELDVTFHIEVTEIYQHSEFTESYELNLQSIDQDEYIFHSVIDAYMINAYISEFSITVVSGTIKTSEELELESYTYPIVIEYDNDSYIDIKDPEENLENYEKMMSLFEDMDRFDANQMQIQMTQKTQLMQGYQSYSEQTSTKMSMQNDPFYFSFEDEGFKTYIEQYEDNDQYLFYETQEDYMYENQYIVHPILMDQHSVLSIIDQLGGTEETTMTDEFIYDPDNMLFEDIEYGYKIDALLKDFMPEDAFQELISIYESQGLNTDVLESSQVTMSLTYIDDVYELEITMAFSFLEPVEQTIRSTVIYEIDYNAFTPKHILDDDLWIAPATTMEDVIFETDPLVSNTIPFSPEPHVFKVYLEAGQYVMHVDSDYVLIDVLNQDGMDGNEFFGYQEPGTWDFKDTFFVKEDGFYYFVAHSNHSVDAYTFYAEKLQYEAEIYEPKTLVYGDNHIEILDRYDLDYFVFDAPRDMFLEVTSDQTTLQFFQSETNKKDYIQNYYVFEFSIGRNWIYVEEGLNYIYFNHPTPIEATLNVKDYGELPHQSNQIEEMSIVSDNFLDTPMLLGPQMGESYLRFDAEKAVYTFSCESSNDILSPRAEIYRTENDEFVDYIYFDQSDTYHLIMEEGSYYMVIRSGNYVEFNIKATSVLIENQIINETLSHIPTYDVPIDQIPYVEGMLIDFEHEPRHRFSIDVPSTIIVGIGDFGHKLYDDSGNLLTFNHVNYGFTRTLYFLDAGTYEISPFMKNPYDTFVDYQMHVAIVDTPVIQDNYYLREPILYENMESPMTFTTDHSYDYEVIKLTVETTSEYYISANKTIYIYNADLEQVEGVSSNVSRFITLEPGVYYLVSSRYPIGNLRISIYPSSYFD